MRGSQLTVFVAMRVSHRPHARVIDWLFEEARRLDIHGATVIEPAECIDVNGKFHAARFVELAEQPRVVTFTSDDARVDALLERLRHGGVPLFYTRCAVEYEVLCGSAA